METLPRCSHTTRTTDTTSIAWIELSSIRMIVSILKGSYGNALRRLRRLGRSKAIPEVITPIPNFLAHMLHFKMAAENTELNTSLFMEEVQKYPAIYNKFSTDYKNKFIRMNIWKAIGKKFSLDAAEAEKKYKNVRTTFGRYLRKKSLFHLVLMLSPLQQSSVIWIGCQTTSTNDHPLSQTCRVVIKGKMMQIMVKKQKAQTMSRTRLNMRKHQVRMTCSLKRLFLQLLILRLLLLLLMMVSQTGVQNRKGNQHQKTMGLKCKEGKGQ